MKSVHPDFLVRKGKLFDSILAAQDSKRLLLEDVVIVANHKRARVLKLPLCILSLAKVRALLEEHKLLAIAH